LRAFTPGKARRVDGEKKVYVLPDAERNENYKRGRKKELTKEKKGKPHQNRLWKLRKNRGKRQRKEAVVGCGGRSPGEKKKATGSMPIANERGMPQEGAGQRAPKKRAR